MAGEKEMPQQPTGLLSPEITSIPGATSQAPGSSYQITVRNTTNQQMQVGVGTFTVVRHNGHCAYDVLPNVPWAHVYGPESFALPAGATRPVAVHVATTGPAGAHDLLLRTTHEPPHSSAAGGHLGSGVQFQTQVTFPGKSVLAPCPKVAEIHVTPKHAAPFIPKPASAPYALIASIGAVVLAVVIIAAVLLHKRSLKRGRS
jgi:hypothetical protein